MGCAWIFLYEAYQRIGVSMASLAYYCGPVIIMVLSPLLFGEKLTRTKVVGFLAVLVGVVLVNGQARPGWGHELGAVLRAHVGGDVCGARDLQQKIHGDYGLENPMIQLTASLVVSAVFSLYKSGFSLHIVQEDWPPVLFLGLVNTGLAAFSTSPPSAVCPPRRWPFAGI